MGFTRLRDQCLVLNKGIQNFRLAYDAPFDVQQSMIQIANALGATRACVAELELLVEK